MPIINWFSSLPKRAIAKCYKLLLRLHILGHELRRPEADYLRDGIYELRIGLHGINYRILYFFYLNKAVVASHGIIKQRVVPPREIDLAVKRKKQFEINPEMHTAKENVTYE